VRGCLSLLSRVKRAWYLESQADTDEAAKSNLSIEGVEMRMAKYLLLSLFILSTLVLVSNGAVTDQPAVGTPAPDFSLTSNEGKKTSLKDFRGKWVALYFYPKDFTSGCTIEAHNFQRDIAKYEKMNAVIIGVSVDTAESHKEFCAKEGLSFKLLSDTDAKVSTDYGSIMEYNGAKLSARNTFIIDPQGKIAKVFIGVKPATHSEEVLSALAALQKS
jgi:thioredoxin-dependent peroxiredoxin